jgi:hypothetical protein
MIRALHSWHDHEADAEHAVFRHPNVLPDVTA